jgi:hypothetical protein
MDKSNAGENQRLVCTKSSFDGVAGKQDPENEMHETKAHDHLKVIRDGTVRNGEIWPE